jgi:hypothetical protein
MQITHEEARRLIQFKADNGLNPASAEKLDMHLKTCTECRGYFNAVKDTESVLRQTLRKQWDIRPLPLSLDAIQAKANFKTGWNFLVTTRTALLGIVFAMFAFITWQSLASGTASYQMPSGAVPLIPTPSTQYTVTNTLQNDCKEIRYIVQEGDTLDGIARQFLVSRESILLANHLTDETLIPSRELILTICGSTPTSTLHPPTLTITPISETLSTTPG